MGPKGGSSVKRWFIHWFPQPPKKGNLTKGRSFMKKALLAGFLLLFLAAGSGCSSTAGTAGLGIIGGAAAGAGGYEFHLKRQKEQVMEDLKNGKIDQKEHDIRLDQIKRDSLLQ